LLDSLLQEFRTRMAGFSSKGGNSPGRSSPLSLNSMQLAIITLKEKCQKQQQTIEELEREKINLEASKENVHSEMQKLHASNQKLREKNLQLSHNLQVKSIECTALSSAAEDRIRTERQSAKQIERLQNQIAVISHRENGSEPSSLVSLSEEARESFSSPQTSLTDQSESSPRDTKSLVDKVANNFNHLKAELKKEQLKLILAVNVLQKNKLNSDQKVESLISAGLSAALGRSKTDSKEKCLKCPMCEAEFPKETSQDEFECHVVEHFSYEESETLRHFDMVPDAFWSCPNSIEDNISS